MTGTKSISLEEIRTESVDLERIPVDEVFAHLKCTKEGLSSEEGDERLQIFGSNKLEEKKENKILKFLGFMWNPLSWVMEAAAIMAIVLANGGGRPPDWQDFVGITVLLVVNSTISFIEENNAGNAAAALMAGLAPKTKVLRDGSWSERDASILVPGDIISIKLGDIVPADARLLEGDPLKIDQSALTGESLPVTKNPSDGVYSGSTCKQGEIEAVVIATGVHTFFGKAAHLVDSTNQVGHFQKVLTSIGNFCICSIAIGMVIEIIVMYPIQHRAYRQGIDNLLVLLIGGIPIAMPTVLSVTMAIGSHRLSMQGAITKRMTAIEEMAGMDVLCSDKTGTLTLNKLTVDKDMIEVFPKGVKKDDVLLLAARASRTENQDAIDAAIVGTLEDPIEARAGVTEVHFLPFNPVDKRTALTYIDDDGNWHRVSKGAPEQIIELCNCKADIKRRAHAVIARYADKGLRSLAVARQEVPEKNNKDSPGGPWQFVGLLALFDPPRHDSADTIRQALNLGVNVKMITGDQLAIAKETGKRLGMGVNMYPSSSLLGGKDNDAAMSSIPIDELIEKADGFAGVFPEHKYEIVKKLQERKHICGMTGDGVNDAPALKKADIGIAVADATDAARSASDIVLTEPGLSVIISAVLTSRAIFQRMKNYTIYAVSITIRIVFGFMFIALIWKFDFSPFMVLIIAILNDGTIMTISKDRVKPSPLPDSWKLEEIFATGVVLGGYMALMTVIFFWAAWETDFFSETFGVHSLHGNKKEMMAALYLQVSIISQALIFVTRSRSWSFVERPGMLLMGAFLAAQLVATVVAVYANWNFAHIKGMGWGWAGVIWIYSIVTYIPLDVLKFGIRYALSGKAWNNMLENKTAFTTKKDYGRDERVAQWATDQRTKHGYPSADTAALFQERSSYRELSEIAEQAKRRAEVARLRELHTLKGHVESIARLKGLDIDTSNHQRTEYERGKRSSKVLILLLSAFFIRLPLQFSFIKTNFRIISIPSSSKASKQRSPPAETLPPFLPPFRSLTPVLINLQSIASPPSSSTPFAQFALSCQVTLCSVQIVLLCVQLFDLMQRQQQQQSSRIDLADLKGQFVKKIGMERSKQYFYYLRRLLTQKLSKNEFDKLCMRVIGKDNLSLHNHLIRSVLKNACDRKVPPVEHEAVRAAKTVADDGHKLSSYASFELNVPWSNGMVSPKKSRSGIRDRKHRDQPCLLGSNGCVDNASHMASAGRDSNGSTIIAENGEFTSCDYQRPLEQSQGLGPPPMSEREASINQPRERDGIQKSIDREDVSCRDDLSRFYLHALLGIPFCGSSIGGSRKPIPTAASSNYSSCCDDGSMPDTESLQKRMEQIAAAQGLEGVSMESANILNNGLDLYLRRLIKSCISLVGGRSGNGSTRQVSLKQEIQSKLLNGLLASNHHYMQNNAGLTEALQEHYRSSSSISMLDFKVAMELNPQQLGEDWPLLLEKICIDQFAE